MSSRIDPIRRERRRLLLAAVAVTATTVLSAVWALSPRGQKRAQGLHLFASATPASAPTDDLTHRLDASHFAAVLWNPPPVASPVEGREARSEKPRPPLRLVLLGITKHSTGRVAAMYDPDADRVVFAAAGDTIGPFVLEQVEAMSVIFADGRTLSLVAQEGAAG